MRFLPRISLSSLLATSARRSVIGCSGVMIACMGAIGFRDALVSLEPRSAVLYSAIGLPVNLAKLDISRVEARINEENARRVLIINGDIVNVTEAQRVIPSMQVTVRGKQNAALFMWTVTPPKQKLNPGETVAFSARLASPPAEGSEVLVEFAGVPHRDAPKTQHPKIVGKTPDKSSEPQKAGETLAHL